MSTTPFGDLIAKAAEAKFVVIPDGEYPIVCVDALATRSSTDKPMLKLSHKVITGPHDGHRLPPDYQTLTADNPVAVKMLLGYFDAFGLDEEFLQSLPPAENGEPNFAAVAQAIKGRVAIGKIGHGEYQGDDKNEVNGAKRPDEVQMAAIKEAMGAEGGDAFAAPSAGPSDPFAASAAAAPGDSSSEPF